MDSFLAKLINIAFKVRTCILSKHLLQVSQVALVINFGARLERLQRLDDLDGEPVALIPDLSNDHFVEPLQTALLKYGEHAIVAEFELVSICICKLELRFLFFVKTLVALIES